SSARMSVVVRSARRRDALASANRFLLHQEVGVANLLPKCKFCGREGSVKMIQGRGFPVTLSNKFSLLMGFECRSFEPVDFRFTRHFQAETTETRGLEENVSDNLLIGFALNLRACLVTGIKG
ncbi:UPF0587 protein, partial [Tanacetum coccineum]